MMKNGLLGSMMVAAAALTGCTTTGGLPPTQVVRYHLEQPIARGSFAVVPGTPDGKAGLEFQPYADAVQRQLVAAGFTSAAPGTVATYDAIVGFSSQDGVGPPRRSPFSIGLGVGGFTGGGGGYRGGGGGVGLGGGVGFPIGGSGQRRVLQTELDVTIKSRAGQTAVWEGHAHTVADLRSPASDTPAMADKLATAMFAGFPGQSGRTIEVK